MTPKWRISLHENPTCRTLNNHQLTKSARNAVSISGPLGATRGHSGPLALQPNMHHILVILQYFCLTRHYSTRNFFCQTESQVYWYTRRSATRWGTEPEIALPAFFPGRIFLSTNETHADPRQCWRMGLRVWKLQKQDARGSRRMEN